VESPTVATCPPVGGAMQDPMVRLPRKESAQSRHQRLFEENVGKTKMKKLEGLHILKMRVRELFTHEASISTPRAHHKGRQPLIECADHDFNIIYFPFYVIFFSFYVLSPFLCYNRSKLTLNKEKDH